MSYLAGLKKEHDQYYDPSRSANGVPLCLGSWEDALGDVLGFCGCGRPEDALLYIRNLLRILNEDSPDSFGPGGREKWNEWYKNHRARIDTFFHNDSGAEYLAYYVLTDKDLLEHGGSVPGWLTQKGKDFLTDLEAHSAELEAE